MNCRLGLAVALALTPAAAGSGVGQEPPAKPLAASPEALASAYRRVLTTGDTTGSDWQQVPPDVRSWVRDVRPDADRLVPGIGRVVHQTPDRAVLVLSGLPEFDGGTAAETSASRGVSGYYEAVREREGWRLGRRLPIDAGNTILAQELDVELRPGEGLLVSDTLTLAIGDSVGFAVRLNHAARLESVRAGGEAIDHEFGGGLLWVGLAPGRRRLVLDYVIDVARDSAAHPNSGRFASDYGHVRNQYYWHPFFDFQSGAQIADFAIRVRGPADVQVATDLPQTETVVGETRTVRARSREPTFALSLFYDREWEPTTSEVEGYRLRHFATRGTPPSTDSLAAAFRRTYSVLRARFGAPTDGYLAFVQGRAREGSGWLFRTNDVIAMPEGGGSRTSRGGGWPRAWFGHELAHGWTRPTGPAANFLREGWATFAEALLLEREFGPEAVEDFWGAERAQYFARFDGRASVLDDPGNQGVAYSKGSWILRMLRDFIGAEAFERGFTSYMATSVEEPAGHEAFAAAMSEASGRDVGAFLRPWLEAVEVPAIEAAIEGDGLVVRQIGPVHPLPLEIELFTPDGTRHRSLLFDQRQAALRLDSRDVTGFEIDPRRRLLIRRTRGDTVRFVLEGAGRAEEVRLHGPFLSQPLSAAPEEDGRWLVEVELSAGTYPYWWSVDGDITGPIEAMDVASRLRVSKSAFGAGLPPSTRETTVEE